MTIGDKFVEELRARGERHGFSVTVEPWHLGWHVNMRREKGSGMTREIVTIGVSIGRRGKFDGANVTVVDLFQTRDHVLGNLPAVYGAISTYGADRKENPTRIVFPRFPPIRSGSFDDGVEFTIDGRRAGSLERIIDWKPVTGGALRQKLAPVITGYRMQRYDLDEGAERSFSDLAEAKAWAREIDVTKLPPPRQGNPVPLLLAGIAAFPVTPVAAGIAAHEHAKHEKNPVVVPFRRPASSSPGEDVSTGRGPSLPPFAVLRGVGPVLLIEDRGQMKGFDIVHDVVYRAHPADILHAVSALPAAAVYPYVHAERAAEELRVANPLGALAPRGAVFEPLPEGVLSGFPVARPQIERYRAETPSVNVIELSMAFALSTVQTSIERAEAAFKCYGKLYLKKAQTPPTSRILGCFVKAGTGLEPTKAEMLSGLAEYARVIHEAIRTGLRDRALRRHLVLETKLPKGLSITKLSFTLALLGHDCICLDARLLGKAFSDDERNEIERALKKPAKGTFSAKSIDTYEAAEDSFLSQNRYYEPNDPLGRARAQWMAWESVGGEGATHSTWLEVVVQA